MGIIVLILSQFKAVHVQKKKSRRSQFGSARHLNSHLYPVSQKRENPNQTKTVRATQHLADQVDQAEVGVEVRLVADLIVVDHHLTEVHQTEAVRVGGSKPLIQFRVPYPMQQA